MYKLNSDLSSKVNTLAQRYSFVGVHSETYPVDGKTTYGTLIKRLCTQALTYIHSLPTDTMLQLMLIRGTVFIKPDAGNYLYYTYTEELDVRGTRIIKGENLNSLNLYYVEFNSTNPIVLTCSLSSSGTTISNVTSSIVPTSNGDFSIQFMLYKKLY